MRHTGTKTTTTTSNKYVKGGLIAGNDYGCCWRGETVHGFCQNIIEDGDFDNRKHSVDMRHTGTETTTTTIRAKNK